MYIKSLKDKIFYHHKLLSLIFLLIILLILLFRHFHIKNFNIVAPEILCTSGQPRGMDYTRLLYKHHITTIVNLRQAGEQREKNWYNEERIWVRQNAVNYFEIPLAVRPDYFPGPQQQTQFLEIMADRQNLPVLLHDSTGKKRVAMLAAVWMIKDKKVSPEDTIKMTEQIIGRKVREEESKFINQLAGKTP